MAHNEQEKVENHTSKLEIDINSILFFGKTWRTALQINPSELNVTKKILVQG